MIKTSWRWNKYHHHLAIFVIVNSWPSSGKLLIFCSDNNWLEGRGKRKVHFQSGKYHSHSPWSPWSSSSSLFYYLSLPILVILKLNHWFHEWFRFIENTFFLRLMTESHQLLVPILSQLELFFCQNFSKKNQVYVLQYIYIDELNSFFSPCIYHVKFDSFR